MGGLENFAASPWLFPAMAVLAMFDALLPPIPSDEIMAALAALAASNHTPGLLWVVPATGAGAFVGDMLCYRVGRAGAPAVLRRWEHKPAVAKSYEWAQRNISRRGWLFILTARYLPFGRCTTMLTCGALKYPFARFCALDALSVSIAVTIGALVGYGGGALFVNAPLSGMFVAVAAITCVSMVRALMKTYRKIRGHEHEQVSSPEIVTN
ncbi:MAG: DedA family protein [Mycobacteriales bacterium]